MGYRHTSATCFDTHNLCAFQNFSPLARNYRPQKGEGKGLIDSYVQDPLNSLIHFYIFLAKEKTISVMKMNYLSLIDMRGRRICNHWPEASFSHVQKLLLLPLWGILWGVRHQRVLQALLGTPPHLPPSICCKALDSTFDPAVPDFEEIIAEHQ